jgi:hypothetical protein
MLGTREIPRYELSRDDEMVIKLSDASEICTHLKNNKACGNDNISYEHIKYVNMLLCYIYFADIYVHVLMFCFQRPLLKIGNKVFYS